MAITTTGFNKWKQWLIDTIKEGRYTINGLAKIIPVYRVDHVGDVITIYLYFDDSIVGTITKYELIDQDNAVFDTQNDNISKTATRGHLVSFKYTISKS